jgi:DNA-binding transcriptional ArsR family regulator
MQVQHSIPDGLVDRVAHRLAVLGQSLRIRIVEQLKVDGEMSVQRLADALDTTQQNVSRHLRLLYEDRIVERRPEGRVVWYRLADTWALTILDDVGAQVARELRELGIDGTQGSDDRALGDWSRSVRDWTADGGNR